jgi:hypothetical protein
MVRVITLRKLVAHIEKGTDGENEGKRRHGRARRRWENDIKRNAKE